MAGAPVHGICEPLVMLNVAPEVGDAHALDGGLHFVGVCISALAVPVLREVQDVAEMKAPCFPSA